MVILPSYVEHPDLPSWLPPPVKKWPKPFEPGYSIRVLQLGLAYAGTQGQDPFDNPPAVGRLPRGGPGPRVMCVANRQHSVPTSFNESPGKTLKEYAAFTERVQTPAPELYRWLDEHGALLHRVPFEGGHHTIINHDHPQLVFFSSEATNKEMDENPGTLQKPVKEQARVFRALADGGGKAGDERALIEWLDERHRVLTRFRQLLAAEKQSNFYRLASLESIWSVTPQKAFDLLCLHRSIPQAGSELADYHPPVHADPADLILLKCLSRAALVWDIWVELAAVLRAHLQATVRDLRYCKHSKVPIKITMASVLRPWVRSIALWFEGITPVENVIDTTLALRPDVRTLFPRNDGGRTASVGQVARQWRADDAQYWRRFVDVFVSICETADWPVDRLVGNWTRADVVERIAPRQMLERSVDRLVASIHNDMGLRTLWLMHRLRLVRVLGGHTAWRKIAWMAWRKSLETIYKLFPLDTMHSSQQSLGLLERAATISVRTTD